MKKVFVVLAAFALFGMYSCTKECTCVTSIDGVEMATQVLETKGACSDLDTETTVMGITTKVVCK